MTMVKNKSEIYEKKDIKFYQENQYSSPLYLSAFANKS